MKFKIICEGRYIALFLNESDRDLCLDILRQTYEDCVFEASNK